MFQKIILFLAAFASSASLISVPASAKEVKNGIEYWTVSEMREFMLETDAEFATLCGDDGRCKQNLLYERAEADGKYRALENFEMEKLIVSSVNPPANTVKLYYQDEDRMLSFMLGQQKTNNIEDFYMLWVEEWLGNPFKNGSWLTYGERYPYFLGDATTVESASHLMIDEDKNRNGAGWFTPNTEREYLITSSNLNDNSAQMFYYSLLESNGGRTNGVKDYRSCFKDTDYEPGMECRYLFGSDGVSRYFPFNPEPTTTSTDSVIEPNSNETNDVTETNPGTKADDTPASTSKEESTTKESSNKKEANQASASVLSVVTKPVIVDTDKAKTTKTNQKDAKTTEQTTPNSDQTAEVSDVQSSSPQTTATTTDATNDATSSTPTVSLPKSGGCEKETIFPWWFIILVMVCDAIIMWFFWPKKSEKGVDKEVHLR